LKLFLDDQRSPPEGWTLVRWPSEMIALLETGEIDEISLDHDLGDDVRGTGYDVLVWIEEAVATRGFRPPMIHLHSANVVGRKRMLQAVQSIQRFAERQR